MTRRELVAMVLVPVLYVTGYRFSKAFRHAAGGWRATVYRHVDTVAANVWAGI